MRKLAVSTITAAAALVTLAAAAPASAETVTATGLAQVRVTAENPNSNASILEAIEAAHELALPLAMANAREEAEELAAASGLTLGTIESVSGGGLGPNGYAFGPFGPNRYCGTVTRRVRVRLSDGRVVRRRVRQRRCFVPRELTTAVTVTYNASRGG